VRRFVALVAFALTTGAPALAAPATTIGDAGGAPVYVRADAAIPLVGVQLVVRGGLDRETTAQNGVAALVAETILRTPVSASGSTPVALRDAVATRGGALSYSVAARYVRFYLEAPPDVLGAIAPLVARALAKPALDAATLTAARNGLGERIADEQKNPVLVGLDAVRTSYYRDAAALPELGTPASLSALRPDDVRAFHDRWYVRGNAFVAAVGRTGSQSEATARALVAALPAGTAPGAPALATRPFGTEPRRIVTRRDVFAPYVVLGFAAPALGDPDFAPALVMRSLLAHVFDQNATTTPPAVRRTVGAIYGYDVAPAQFALWINGARLDPSTGLAAIDALVKDASSKPLTQPVLDRYKESARGEWQLESVTLEERAWSIGNAVALGLDPNAVDTIPAAIDRVTAADVQRVAKRWFAHFDVALVLPRGGTGG
jgi:zinc protease